MSDFIEMVTVVPIEIGPIGIEAEQHLFVKEDGDKVIIRIDDSIYFETTVSKSYLEECNKLSFDSMFATLEDVNSVVTYGSEIRLLTKKGIVSYSVESICFRNDGIAYATLDLKIL